ncbi:hypothetical protein D3C80_2180840 [compost metagenome]
MSPLTPTKNKGKYKKKHPFPCENFIKEIFKISHKKFPTLALYFLKKINKQTRNNIKKKKGINAVHTGL